MTFQAADGGPGRVSPGTATRRSGEGDALGSRAPADGQRRAASVVPPFFTPEQFGASIGSTENTPAFQALAAAVQAAGGGVVLFPPNRSYQVFNGGTLPADQTVLFKLSNLPAVKILMNGSKIVTSADLAGGAGGPVSAYAFLFTNCDFVDLEFAVEQAIPKTASQAGGLSGAVFNDTCRNCTIKGEMIGGKLGVLIIRDPTRTLAPEMRAHNFDIELRTKNTFYPLNCQFNGDNLTGKIFTEGAGRSYFVYNVSNHDVLVSSDGHAPGYDDCLIKAYALPNGGAIAGDVAAGLPSDDSVTSNITVKYKCRYAPGSSTTNTNTSIAFDQHGGNGSVYYPARISGVTVALDVDMTGVKDPQAILNFVRSGRRGVYDPATVAHVLENVDASVMLRGTQGPSSDAQVIDFFYFQAQDPTGILARNIRFHDIVSQFEAKGSQAPQMGFDGRCLQNPLTLRDISADGKLLLRNMPSGKLIASNVKTANFTSADILQASTYTRAQFTSAFIAAMPADVMLFMSDGREPGQAAGRGTGIFVFKNGAGHLRSVFGGAPSD